MKELETKLCSINGWCCIFLTSMFWQFWLIQTPFTKTQKQNATALCYTWYKNKKKTFLYKNTNIGWKQSALQFPSDCVRQPWLLISQSNHNTLLFYEYDVLFNILWIILTLSVLPRAFYHHGNVMLYCLNVMLSEIIML